MSDNERLEAALAAATRRAEAAIFERDTLRDAGNTVSAHVYASVSPGAIPMFVRLAMYEFEQANEREVVKKRVAGGETRELLDSPN